MFFNSSADFDERVSLRAAEFCEHVIAEMGAELHDDLIQKLSAMSFFLERIERASNEPSEVLTLITRMRTDFESVTQTVRAISRRLNPIHTSGATFASNIALLCETMERPGNGHINFTSIGTEQHLGQLAYTYLYRIIQELIHNAFKHSAAWRVDVRMEWTPNVLMIQVEDDGTGHLNMDVITSTLQTKQNTLHLRSHAINASMKYSKGKKGLLVRLDYPIHHHL